MVESPHYHGSLRTLCRPNAGHIIDGHGGLSDVGRQNHLRKVNSMVYWGIELQLMGFINQQTSLSMVFFGGYNNMI